MVTDDDEPVHRPFGGYTLDVETLPDGRTIRYYAWPPEADDAAGVEAPEAEPAEPGQP